MRLQRLTVPLAASVLLTLLTVAAAPAPVPARPATRGLLLAGIAGVAGVAGADSSAVAVPASARGLAYAEGSSVLLHPDGRLDAGPDAERAWRGGAILFRALALGGTDAFVQEGLAAEVEAARAWLAAGAVPGRLGPERDMAERALLDLRLLTGSGAAVAGWHPYWRFVWPRDASWYAAAFTVTGHPEEAASILRFLGQVQEDDGGWEARYHPDSGRPVRDGRSAQADANGWVLWAVWLLATVHPDDPQVVATLTDLWPTVTAAADAAAESLDDRGLPPASPDYWETRTSQPTIATCAALLMGLRAAADLASRLGHDDEAASWRVAARRLDAGVRAEFGAAGYARTPEPGAGADAGVTFLAPPFAAPDRAVAAAVRDAARRLRLPNGGVLPGERWRGDLTAAWTPETAFFALAAAASGDRAGADHWLGWLERHRTALGALPEKVDRLGRPASVAPLGWTGAAVLLALVARDSGLPVPPARDTAPPVPPAP